MLRRVIRATVAVWAAAALELFAVARIHRAELTSAWELFVGALWLAPMVLVAAAPVALLGAWIGRLLERPGPRLERILFAATAFVGAGAIGVSVATGRHFAAAGQRGGFALFVGSVAAAVAYGAKPALSAALERRPWAFAATVSCAVLGLEVLNQRVLVRLYPGFHAGLAVLSLAAIPVAAWPLVRQERPGRGLGRALAGGVVGLVLVGSIATVRPAAERLAGFDNFRLVISEGAPVLRHAVLLASRLAPPKVAEVDPCFLNPATCTHDAQVDSGPSFLGRDIVLVTIDALRADHVSTYGYGRPTTPHLDALARESVVFERAYCATPHTSYSVTSLMTGKYMRPLLLQDSGKDTETLATYLRTYGYRTAAFYPPAVFFIDQARFEPFEKSHFGFEYAKVEFLEGAPRVAQVDRYLGRLPPDKRLLLWVHLFGPHEPYEAQEGHSFGDRDVDRYDSEVAAADETVGAIVARVRKDRPRAVVIVTADHGEEFGDHGGRYHGTTVYEEQVRVPLLVSAPDLAPPRRVKQVVQSIDLVPTILAALSVPASPRIRGRNLGALLTGTRPEEPGLAFAETDDFALLAEGPLRLVCERKVAACRLYDVDRDPGERDDLSSAQAAASVRMRGELQALGASHGRFELLGLRAEGGKGWPGPIRRGIAGDADAAPELAVLLDDADRDIRRKAAELLFELKRPDTLPALRLALSRDEDAAVRQYAALALTRLGEAAPLTMDLLNGTDPKLRQLAALALAEAGDARGAGVLIDFWQHGGRRDHTRALELLGAFRKLRSKDAVWPLVQALGDVRLRPQIAETLAAIGDDTARGPLVAALNEERYQTARIAIADALVALGAREELARPLVRLLGVPDPLPGGLGYALKARVLEFVGGPDAKGLKALERQSDAGVAIHLVVPKSASGSRDVRLLVRARADGAPGEVRVGKRLDPLMFDSKGMPLRQRELPKIHAHEYVSAHIPPGPTAVEIGTPVPGSLGVVPGRAVELVVFAERHVHVEALAMVPLSDELPPPPPEPWSQTGGAPEDAP